MRTIYIILASLLVCLALLVGGVWYIVQPNVRWYLKDNIKFWADLYIKDERRYNILEIGTKDKPFHTSKVHFSFKYDENNIFNSMSIDTKKLRALSEKITNPNKFNPTWPEGSETLKLGSYSITINSDKILKLIANGVVTSSAQPKISKGTSKNFYTFPLSENQVVEVFGKEDRFHEFFKH